MEDLKSATDEDINFCSEIYIESLHTTFKKDVHIKKFLDSTFSGCKIKNALSEESYIPSPIIELDLERTNILFQNSDNS
ncbi:MAG: hypothetical protein COA71_14655 [SAR86 cluster bacterium]|uniref:Uncharacterized protein n=1 Tax=SAR86 cluster bacterium TaxID=2030880 RepID=A0A2A5C5Z9_9GAMM|nr:MAG: hypothetical protein COA71_14655 [SAR86 cluster bacterium]